jgi:hypothetical protein
MALLIDGYEIDIAESEEHVFENEVTEHPVESGGDITDHVRARAISLTIEGIVSDTPLAALAQRRNELVVIGGETFAKPSEEAFARLLEINATREPITIETSLRSYTDMVLEHFSAPRNAGTGDALRFTATFKQIRLVTNERTTILVATPRGSKPVNRGQAFAPVVEAPAQTSANANALANSVGVLR